MAESILIVEDDDVVREMLYQYTESFGYTALGTASADQALDFLERESIDLVITDLKLPGMDGLDLARSCLEQDPDRPVLLMTAYADLDSARQAIDIGVSDYFVKPLNPRHIMTGIQRALERRRELLERRAYQADLERETEERTAELRALNEQLRQEAAGRAQSEETLRQERDLLRRIAETSPVGITVLDAQGRITFANACAEEVLGLSKDDITQRTYNDPEWRITDSTGRPFPDEELPFQRVMRTGQPVRDVRHAIAWPDGRRVLLSVNATPLLDASGQVDGVVATMDDITGQVWMMEAMDASDRRLNGILSSMVDTVFTFDRVGRFTFCSSPPSELQMAPERFMGKKHSEVMPPHIDRLFVHAFEENRAGRAAEYEYSLDVGGSTQWYSAKLSPLLLDGEFEGAVAVVRNITEHKQAEEALRESEEKYRQLFSSESDAIMVFDAEARQFLDVNRSCELLYGYSREEFLNLKVTDISDEPEDTERSIGETLEGRLDRIPVRYHRKKDGTVFPAEISAGTFKVKGRQVLCGVIRDITERKRVEEEMVQLERLRALGELSAGVSHNLNNILTSVLGPAQMLQRISDDPRVLREAEDIIAAARRARDLVHRLHMSTRETEEEALHPVQVNDMVREAVQAARPKWKDESESEGITIEVETDLGDAPPIRGTASRLHDMVLNLLFNAVDAMPEGGRVTIRTRAVAGGVRMTVEDTGIGMEEAVRRRVFEPFFTTKQDVGSGLGLSTAYGAVTQWGGRIEVESAPGAGTTFALDLPAWTELPEEEEATREARPVRRGRVLVVEDDEGVCRLLSRLLEGIHEVEVAQSGREALERFAPGRYDVALIDIGMPEMPGDRVAHEICRQDPALVTVLITGWELGEEDPRGSLFDFRIQKPFDDLDEVVDVVARAIDLHDGRVS